jgi:hypothetical protein
MFPRKSFLSGTSALDIALQNEKAESLLTTREVKIVSELGLNARRVRPSGKRFSLRNLDH